MTKQQLFQLKPNNIATGIAHKGTKITNDTGWISWYLRRFCSSFRTQ